MFRLVMTMGIVQVEQNRLRQQEIEVKALIALANYGANDRQRWKALAALEKLAYPNELADKINQETII